MKKTTKLIGLLILVLVLTACGDAGQSTRTFELSQDGILTTLVYTYKDDVVSKQSAKNVIPYSLIGVTSKEEAKALLAPMSEEFQGYDGLTHKIDYDNEKAIETIVVDYTVLDFKAVEDLPGMMFDGDAAELGISMEQSAQMLQEQGFVEIKK